MRCHDNSHDTQEWAWSGDLNSELREVSEDYHESEVDSAHGLCSEVLAIVAAVNERV